MNNYDDYGNNYEDYGKLISTTRRYGVSDPTILAHGGPRPLLYRKENDHFVPGDFGGRRRTNGGRTTGILRV
jgi:hypothetical protein